MSVSHGQIETLVAWCQLVAQWNSAYNLIGPRTVPDIVSRHVLDALALSAFMPESVHNILDIGTGAGLPGFPLAVTHPHRHFTLVDRRRKKTRFVQQAQIELDINNIEVVTGDVSDCVEGQFDCIMARAVGMTAELARMSAPLLAPDGICLFPRGMHAEAELSELSDEWEAKFVPLEVSGAHSQTILAVLRHRVDAEAGA